MPIIDLRERLRGLLLGTALGDALGLPAEGLKPRAIQRRFGRLERFRLLGPIGFVSDDTEQAALLAQSLARATEELPLGHERWLARCVAHFRWALVGWFWRLPFGIGLSTLRACLKLSFGSPHSGVASAGNGAAMRAAVIGCWLAEPDREALRIALGRAIAEVTHTDARGVEGALYVAEVAAGLTRDLAPELAVGAARPLVTDSQLGAAIDQGVALAADPSVDHPAAAERLGSSGFVVHTLALATFCLLRARADVLETLADTVGAGGDTDTIGAIVGAWLGAARGRGALPAELIAHLNDGPFGPTHLSALADALTDGGLPPRYSRALAMLRNLALYPVVLGHGLRRLLPL